MSHFVAVDGRLAAAAYTSQYTSEAVGTHNSAKKNAGTVFVLRDL